MYYPHLRTFPLISDREEGRGEERERERQGETEICCLPYGHRPLLGIKPVTFCAEMTLQETEPLGQGLRFV